MSNLPNMKLYRECPQCHALSFGKHDAYCSLCGCKLKDSEAQLAGIRDYAKSLLILYLANNPKEAMEAHINEIPDYALGKMRDKGFAMHSQNAARHILWHVEAEWQEIANGFDVCEERLNHETLVKAIDQLKSG